MVYTRKLFLLKDSPFTKERNMKNKDKTIGVRVPEDIHEDISKYFKGVYGENFMSKGINDMLVNTLNKVCTEKGLFSNISIFMLIPKTEDIDKLTDDSIVFALVDELHDFSNYNTNIFKNKEFDLPFIEGALNDDFSMMPIPFLLDVENHCFIDMNIEDLPQSDFLDKLASTYDINLEDYYWTHLKLNNYLDEYRDGQYQAPIYNNEHIGAYILRNPIHLKENTPFEEICLYLTIKWVYYDEIDMIDVKPQFAREKEFLSYIHDAKDEELSKKAFKIIYGEDTKEYLINMKKTLESDLSTIQTLIKSIDEKLDKEYS